MWSDEREGGRMGKLRLTRGGLSKATWRSRMRLLEPLTRNVPGTSIAGIQRDEQQGGGARARTDRFP